MEVSIYVENEDIHDFYRWVNRLSQGHIESSPIKFSHKDQDFLDPLEIHLSANEYAMICDAREEIERVKKFGGPLKITYSPTDRDWQLSTIRNIIKNSERHDLTVEVLYTALSTISKIPDITPAEAMIIAEGEWIK